MKIFGNQRQESNQTSASAESIPVPKDKSLHHREAAPSIDEEDNWDDLDDEEELYDEYDEDDDDDDDDEYEDDEYDEDDEDDVESGSKKKRILIIVVIALLLLVFVAAGVFINYLLNLINYQQANSTFFATAATAEELPEETPVSSYLAQLEAAEQAKYLEATEEELAQWDKKIEDITSDDSSYAVPITDDVFNVLLIGSDTRATGEVGRSDAMIIVTLNQKTKQIYLTSFLRDCYVYIPGYGNTRLNHAFAYGGPELLEETLEANFKVHIDRYVMVDFFSFMDVIDILGGVYINISEEETEITNDYIWSMNLLMDEEWSNDYLWYSGYRLLNGKQALCYCRNRYTGNDYARTERQRNVINQILVASQMSSASTLVDMAQAVLPHVTTDMSKSEILNYAANIAAYADYEIKQQQVPTTDTYYGAMIDGMSVISMDFDANIAMIQKTIYAGTESN